jgi:hypothetical protein
MIHWLKFHVAFSWIFLSLFYHSFSQVQGKLHSVPAFNKYDSLTTEIISMGREDQDLRKRLESYPSTADSLPNPHTQLDQLENYSKTHPKSALIDLIRQKDREHLARLKIIVENIGWPTKNLVGEAASSYAFLILQHGDLPTQKKYFPLLEASAKRGEASLAHVALMQDRILVGEGKEQLYGTQFHAFNGSKLRLYPVVDPKNVNKRRAQMGLGTLEEYIKIMGVPVEDY